MRASSLELTMLVTPFASSDAQALGDLTKVNY